MLNPLDGPAETHGSYCSREENIFSVFHAAVIRAVTRIVLRANFRGSRRIRNDLWEVISNLSAYHGPRKCLKAAVIRLFDIIREATRGQFLHCEMVPDAFAAHSLARARFVAAVTVFYILGFIAFH
jgi:hypothetical protein